MRQMQARLLAKQGQVDVCLVRGGRHSLQELQDAVPMRDMRLGLLSRSAEQLQMQTVRDTELRSLQWKRLFIVPTMRVGLRQEW